MSALLLCPAFGAEALAAAASIDPGRLHLATCHFEREGSELRSFVTPIERGGPRSAPTQPSPEPLAQFRTGLSDSDLGVSAEEKSALETLTPREASARSDWTEIL